MRRSFLFSALAILVCASVSLAGIHATTSVGKPHKLVPAATKTNKIALKAKTAKTLKSSSDDTIAYDVLLSEDFSKCTSGSEAYPDIYTISDEETLTIDSQYTQSDGWSGTQIYQAGGCIYVALDSDNEPGLLNTPYFDSTQNEGKFIITFRARTQTAGTMDALCAVSCDMNLYNPNNPNPSILEYKFLKATSDWTDYTVALKGGSTKTIVQLYAYSQPIFIDDIVVKQVKTDALSAPQVYNASKFSADGFTATWGEVSNAESYLLNVFYRQEAVADADGPTTITEGFDGLVGTGSKNKFIDTENSQMPKDWVINLSENGTSREIYTTEGNYNSPSVSLCFDATGDYIETPTTDEPIESFSMWVKAQGASEDTELSFEGYDGTSWTDLGDYVFEGWGENEAKTTSWVINNSDCIKLRIGFKKGTKGNLAIDDVSYTYGKEDTEANKVYVIKDLEVTECSYDVTGLEYGPTYYYNVRAKKGDIVSDYSTDVMVVEEQLEAPVALEATNVTADSFTANWEHVENADAYVVTTFQYHTTAAGEDYNLFTSKFDAWTKGTVDNPTTADDMIEDDEQFTAHNIYGNRYDWVVNDPVGANGMIGFKVGGSIDSGSLYPTEAGGTVTATFKAIAKNATKAVLTVYYNNDEFDSKEVELKEGENEYTLTADCGQDAYNIEISAEGEEDGYVLFSSLKVDQNFPNETTIDFNYIQDGTYDNYLVVDTKGIDPKDQFMYTVYAVKVVEGEITDVSFFSDFIFVDGRDASVSKIEANKGYKVLTTANGVTVVLESAEPVAAYSLDGRLLYNAGAGALSHDIALPSHGVYVLRVGNQSTKVAR